MNIIQLLFINMFTPTKSSKTFAQHMIHVYRTLYTNKSQAMFDYNFGY